MSEEVYMKQDTMYLIIRGMTGLAFHMMFTAAGLYRIDIAKLEIYQLILIGTALEIAIFTFEVPTGIVADLKSRKLSVVIGMFIISLGIFIEPLTSLFFVIFISQIIFGFGYTFISGALDSWISDEIKIEDLEKTIIGGSQVYKLTSVIGIILAALIGMINIRYPLYLASFIFVVLGFMSAFFMKELNFHKQSTEQRFYKRYYKQLVKGFSHIRNHQVLRIMFVILLFYGLFSEGIDRTYELHILDNLGFRQLWNIPAIWTLSIVSAIVALVGYLMLYIVKRHINKGNLIYLWAFNFTIMMIIGILMFAYMPYAYLALFGYIFFSISREGTHPLLNSILLKNTPSKIKATVLSSFGQLDAIGQLLSGGLMVMISIWLNIKGLYLVTALLLVVPMLAFIKLFSKKEEVIIEQ